MYRKRAEERMRTLRGLTRLQELSRRIVAAWEEAYEGARKEQHADVVLVHKVATIELPVRVVTEAEAAEARSKVETLSKDPRNRRLVVWHQEVVDRYERQKAGTVDPFTMELHVIRLGDVAIATNVFELFTEFGIQIKARSRALQTFVIQLAGPGSYVPTGARRPGRGLQRDRGEQPRRAGRRPGPRRADRGAHQFPLAGGLTRARRVNRTFCKNDIIQPALLAGSRHSYECSYELNLKRGSFSQSRRDDR